MISDPDDLYLDNSQADTSGESESYNRWVIDDDSGSMHGSSAAKQQWCYILSTDEKVKHSMTACVVEGYLGNQSGCHCQKSLQEDRLSPDSLQEERQAEAFADGLVDLFVFSKSDYTEFGLTISNTLPIIAQNKNYKGSI